MAERDRNWFKTQDRAEYLNSAGVDQAAFSEREGAGWHGMGKPIPAEIKSDANKIAEFLGATYRVGPAPIYVKNGAGVYVPVSGYAAQVRDDSGAVMSVTSDNRYFTENRQPRDIIAAFADEFRANRAELSHAFIGKGGRMVVVSALLDPEFDLVIGKGDRIRRYTTLSTGYDNRNGTVATEGEERVVCNNTWTWNIQDAKNGKAGTKLAGISASQKLAAGQLQQLIKAVVAGGTDGGAFETVQDNTVKAYASEIQTSSVAKVIERIAARAKLEQRTYDEMANARLGSADVARYFADVLGVNIADLDKTHPDGRKMVSQKMQNLMQKLTADYHNAPGSTLAGDTVWGAFNAVTYYATHQKPVRDTAGDGEHIARVHSNMFGDAKALKQRALQLALARVKVAA
jgi:hypothetical protein